MKLPFRANTLLCCVGLCHIIHSEGSVPLHPPPLPHTHTRQHAALFAAKHSGGSLPSDPSLEAAGKATVLIVSEQLTNVKQGAPRRMPSEGRVRRGKGGGGRWEEEEDTVM